ncbi:hypothetical protein H4217_006469 [Coemansia sp. RSA 1939]|nr:hypothetical protein H4217_006469 [Coemansia sp. RSA 1939]KAJ2604661.1 hypothetical protein EV177_006348 [Coemansia sp. RSA 1804]
MDDYQDMAVQAGTADIGSVAIGHPRYSRYQQHHHHHHNSQYAPDAYAQGGVVVHGQPGAPGPVAGYEWGAYQSQDAYMHGSNASMARQPLVPGPGGVGAYSAAHKSSTSSTTTQPLRSKITERLQQIDREAFETEERRYQQRAEDIQNELMLVLRGTHPVFVEGVTRLAAERDRAVAMSEQNHMYLMDLYEKTYRAEREQAEKAYKSEKQAVFEKIAADIEERRKRLKEEKDSLDISIDFVFESGSRTSAKRNLRKRGMDPLGLGDTAASSGSTRHQSKRKNAQAFLLQGIAEDDVVSDLVAIRRATGVTGPLGAVTNGKKGGKGSKR